MDLEVLTRKFVTKLNEGKVCNQVSVCCPWLVKCTIKTFFWHQFIYVCHVIFKLISTACLKHTPSYSKHKSSNNGKKVCLPYDNIINYNKIRCSVYDLRFIQWQFPTELLRWWESKHNKLLLRVMFFHFIRGTLSNHLLKLLFCFLFYFYFIFHFIALAKLVFCSLLAEHSTQNNTISSKPQIFVVVMQLNQHFSLTVSARGRVKSMNNKNAIKLSFFGNAEVLWRAHFYWYEFLYFSCS